jgi:hypothetical protein
VILRQSFINVFYKHENIGTTKTYVGHGSYVGMNIFPKELGGGGGLKCVHVANGEGQFNVK